MIYYYFINQDWEMIMTTLGIITALGVILMLAVAVDLSYGIKESKKAGQYTHSNGLKMTASKLRSYYSLFLIGFFLDSVNPMFFYWDIPYLPIIAIIITVYFLVTEFISVREHLSEGMREKFRNTPEEVKDIVNQFKEMADDIKDLKNR